VPRTTQDPRLHFVGVRLTENEHRRLRAYATLKGLSLSDALRRLIPREILEEPEEPEKVETTQKPKT
jgi:hypothetical protein